MSGDENELKGPVSLSGRTIAGRYRVIGVVGEGGIGKVYEAEQLGLDRMVAVKVIRPERRGDDITLRRFLREARAAGRISSPHVVTLFDCGTDEETGELYIAMELLSGQSLSTRLALGDSMPLGDVLKTAASVARGLRAAHEAGVLHRDLKPANVFLCDDGNTKVLDFGIAKLLDDQPDEQEPLTQVDRLLGTPVYMSPEAAMRRPLGPTTDLYALGLLIYEMVVGSPPFKTGDAWKTLRAHIKTKPPRLRAAAPWRAVPPALDELVAKLLRKRPEDRPRDAGDVADLLERLATRAALASARHDEPTQVEICLPSRDASVTRIESPPLALASADSGRTSHDSLEPTSTWLGPGATPAPESSLAEEVGRPFPGAELAAFRREREGLRRAAEASHALSRRQLWLAATLLGALTFVTMLVMRIML